MELGPCPGWGTHSNHPGLEFPCPLLFNVGSEQWVPPRGTGGGEPGWEMGLGWHRDLPMPRKEMSEETEPSSSPQSDGRARRDIWRLFSAGPGARGVEISKIQQGGSWWDPRVSSQPPRRVLEPAHQQPQLCSANPNSPQHLPHGTSCSGCSQNPWI